MSQCPKTKSRRRKALARTVGQLGHPVGTHCPFHHRGLFPAMGSFRASGIGSYRLIPGRVLLTATLLVTAFKDCSRFMPGGPVPAVISA